MKETVIGRILREMEGEGCRSVRATAVHSKIRCQCRWREKEWERDKDRKRVRESVKPCTTDMRYKSPETRWQISTGSICCTSAGTQHTPSIPTHRSWVCVCVSLYCVSVCVWLWRSDWGLGSAVGGGRRDMEGKRMEQVGGWTEIESCVGCRYLSTDQSRPCIFYNFKIKA